MDRAYTEFDREDKGSFTYRELADKLIDIGAAFPKDTLVSLIQDIDTDNDGHISKVGQLRSSPGTFAKTDLHLPARPATVVSNLPT